MYQRICAMSVVRQLCEDAIILQFLFATYDQRWEVQLDAVQAMLDCCVSIIVSMEHGAPDDDVFQAVGGLYHEKAEGEGNKAPWPLSDLLRPAAR